jgi:hypothetical protein
LLQGDRLDLGLVFEPSPAGDPEFDFEVDLDESGAEAGLAGQAVITEGGSDSENDATLQIARILSSPATPPGVYPVRISARFAGGRTIEARANVVVRRPLEPLVRAETLRIAPGGSAVLRVGVLREPGCIGEVEIRVGDLPAGVSISSPTTLSEGESEILLRLEMAKNAPEIATERELSVVAVARMPRGAVATETVNRPRIVSAPAE